ncbi:hypothetical protein CsSME_00021968 [Camellia sinensis var. sinensis]
MVIAVKKLKPEGFQGHKEWLTEVNYLGQLHHPNLVKLIGYCSEGDNRLLVYEFMPKGSLENHLFRSKLHISMNILGIIHRFYYRFIINFWCLFFSFSYKHFVHVLCTTCLFVTFVCLLCFYYWCDGTISLGNCLSVREADYFN